MSLSHLEEHPGGETFTREEYYRVNGLGPVPSKCRECGTPLTSVQVKRGGKFCSSRCGGKWNAKIPAKPRPTEAPTSQPEGWDHPALTVTPGETTVGGSGAAPAAEKRVPVTAGATEGEPPLRAAELPTMHLDDAGSIPIAAALVQLLLTLPGCRLVEIHVGPIEVRR